MLTFNVKLEKDTNDTWLATCPSLPEVAAIGDGESDALQEAIDAIETAIQGRIADRQPIPCDERDKARHHRVALSAQVAAKVLLHNEMLAQGVRKTELARRLGVHPPQVDRLLDLRHKSKLEVLEAAFEEMGKHLDVRIAS